MLIKRIRKKVFDLHYEKGENIFGNFFLVTQSLNVNEFNLIENSFNLLDPACTYNFGEVSNKKSKILFFSSILIHQ